MLHVGMKGSYTVKVTNDNTALAMGSGELAVFATPAMLAAMEKASTECIKNELSQEESSVGTKADITHISATPVNMSVTAVAVLEKIEGRKLLFSVSAEDECGIIGQGIHERFIVNKTKFTEKTNSKTKEG